jgi:hypothetical protein
LVFRGPCMRFDKAERKPEPIQDDEPPSKTGDAGSGNASCENWSLG